MARLESIALFVRNGLQSHRPEQAGWNEGLVIRFLELRDVRAGAALLLRQLRVADQAVRPAVDDLDLDRKSVV